MKTTPEKNKNTNVNYNTFNDNQIKENKSDKRKYEKTNFNVIII